MKKGSVKKWLILRVLIGEPNWGFSSVRFETCHHEGVAFSPIFYNTKEEAEKEAQNVNNGDIWQIVEVYTEP